MLVDHLKVGIHPLYVVIHPDNIPREAASDPGMIDSLKKLWWLLSSRDKRNTILISLLLLVNGLVEMVGVGIIPVYVSIIAFPNKVIENDYVQAVFSEPGELITEATLLYWGSAALVLFFTFKLVFTVTLSYWQGRFVQNRVLKLGDRLFTAYMRAPYTFHLRRNSAQLLRNVVNECPHLGAGVLMPLVLILTHLVVLLAITGLLVAASPGFAVTALVLFIVVAAGISGTLHRKFKELGHHAQKARGDMVRSVNEGLGGVKEIKILKRENAFLGRFHRAFAIQMTIQRFMQVIAQAIPVTMEWVSVMALLVVIFMLFGVGMSPEAVVSTVVLFAVSLLRLKGAMSSLVGRYTHLQHNLVSVDVVYNDLQQLEQAARDESEFRWTSVLESEQAEPRIRFTDSIRLDQVSYRYPGGHEDALQGISLSITKGEAVGFVGPTGSGKSTLMDIVLGVLRPTLGRMLVDDLDIRWDTAAWQRDIGYIPQSIYLIDGSIRENIALGVPPGEIDQASVSNVLTAARLDNFVEELPDGIDTVVGERGVRLSGGQRQRVAIARALYHNPDVLVMDEATSALDNVTEKSVIKAVEELKGERTILMIAHRLTTVRNCDRIVVLGQGRITAIGRYEELIRDSKEFRQMAGA